METEIKDKIQLQKVKDKVEKILGKKVLEIKCLVNDDFIPIPYCSIGVIIDNGIKGKIGFFIDSFKDKDLINNAIETTCNSLKKELM